MSIISMIFMLVTLFTAAAVYYCFQIADRKPHKPIGSKTVMQNQAISEVKERVQRDTGQKSANESKGSAQDIPEHQEVNVAKEIEKAKARAKGIANHPIETEHREETSSSLFNILNLKDLLDEVKADAATDNGAVIKHQTKIDLPKIIPADSTSRSSEAVASYVQKNQETKAPKGGGLSDVPDWEKRLHEVRMYRHKTKKNFWMAVKYHGFYLPGKEISEDEYRLHHEAPYEAKELVIKYYENEITRILQESNNVEAIYPAGKDLEMIVLKPIPFSGFSHLKNFANYLLRTDRYQKWTNDLTPVCNMAFQRNTKQIYKMDSFKNRLLTRDILMKDAMKGVSGKQVGHLCMQVVELHSITGNEIEVSDEQCLHLFKEYIRYCEERMRDKEVLAYIEHSDGNNRPYHIHTLCRWKAK